MAAVDPGPLNCPHCGSGDVDRGATGLDLCNQCGGLSRHGHVLERPVPANQIVVMRGDHPAKIPQEEMKAFCDALNGLLGGGVLVVHVPDGMSLEIADEEQMAAWGWVRSPDWDPETRSMRGTDAISETEAQDGSTAADQPR